MKLLNEFIDEWNVTSLEREYKLLMLEYKNLVQYTMLNEGVLDNLPDDIIAKVAEIEKRLDAIQRARTAVNTLTKLNRDNPNRGYTQDQAKEHRKKFDRYKKSLTALLAQARAMMQELDREIQQEVDPESEPEPAPIPPMDDDGEGELSKRELWVLNKASRGDIDVTDLEQSDIDMLSDLEIKGYIDGGDELTAKGKDALRQHRKGRMKGRTRSGYNYDPDLED